MTTVDILISIGVIIGITVTVIIVLKQAWSAGFDQGYTACIDDVTKSLAKHDIIIEVDYVPIRTGLKWRS